MLLDEDPATLIQHTIGNFNIVPDKQAVARINESLSTLQQARDLRVREADSALKKLSRTLTTLKNNHNETLSTHSSTAHASEIATLDTQKFRIAKAASDIEIESERLSSQLVDLQARLQELEMQGVDGGDNARRGPVADELSLKLKLFRSLGIEARRGEGVGYNEVVIEKSTDGGPQVFTLKEKFSSFYKANHIWEVL